MGILKHIIILALFILLSSYYNHKVIPEISSEKYKDLHEYKNNKPEKSEDFIRSNRLLAETTEGINPGEALVVVFGCEGKYSTFLAQKGWNVTCFNIADEAFKSMDDKAKERKLNITTVHTSIDNFDFGIYKWDLVVLCYVDAISGGCIANDNFIPIVAASIKKGGLIIYEMGHRDFYLKNLNHPGSWGCTEEQLTQNFLHAGFEILKCEANTGMVNPAKDQPLKELEFVAKKL